MADALEEAGCQSNNKCPTCKGECVIRQEHPWGDTYAIEILTCYDCEGFGYVPHPLISHLRSSNSHYRGCWAIDSLIKNF